MVITYSKRKDQAGKVAHPARGQRNRENNVSSVPVSRLRIWSHGTGSAVPSRVSLLISIRSVQRLGGGGGGCNNFVPVLRRNGTKIAPTGDMFDEVPGQMR